MPITRQPPIHAEVSDYIPLRGRTLKRTISASKRDFCDSKPLARLGQVKETDEYLHVIMYHNLTGIKSEDTSRSPPTEIDRGGA